MKLNPFSKDKKPARKTSVKKEAVSATEETTVQKSSGPVINFSAGAYKVLKNFYVSEKASILAAQNQYVFMVGRDTNKSEVCKNVEKIFNVKVKDIKIINLPSKVRNVGRHSGIKPGFKKAIVILKDGYAIEQAKA
jgi:large subunit ribosomal protein L23